MKWLIAGVNKRNLADFVLWLEENGIQVGTPFEVDDIWQVPYRPVGKEQREKCERHIEFRCKHDLM